MFDPASPLLARPTNWPYRDAVGIVVVNQQNLVLVGKARGRLDIWKMPQGGVEAAETHLEAAQRELLEETGIRKADIQRQAKLRSATEYPAGSNYMPGFRGQLFEWFLARVTEETELDPAKFTPATEDQEFDGLRWVTPLEAIDLAHNSKGGDHVTFQRQKIYKDVCLEFGLLQTNATPERKPLKRPTQDHKPIT